MPFLVTNSLLFLETVQEKMLYSLIAQVAKMDDLIRKYYVLNCLFSICIWSLRKQKGFENSHKVVKEPFSGLYLVHKIGIG